MMQQPSTPSVDSDQPTDIHLAFWNVQNLFDVDGSAIATELEFTPAFGWDRAAFDLKIHNLAEVIRQMNDGRGPDLLGLCEVENERVAQRLLREIGRSDYRLAHVQQPEVRGLDTCLIYSEQIFEFHEKSSRGHVVDLRFPTRDIFEVHLTVRGNGAHLVVLVNHWPSRRAGRYETDPLRIAVASQCGRIIDNLVKLPRREYLELNDNDVSLFQLNQAWDRNVLLMGDLNDEPWSRSVSDVLNGGYSIEHMDQSLRMLKGSLPSWRSYSARRAPLFNPMPSLLTAPDQGTHYEAGRSQPMSLRDQFLLSRGLYFGLGGLQPREMCAGVPRVDIFRPEILTTRKNRPREFRRDTRTGCSDHFPVTLTLQTVTTNEHSGSG